MTKLETFATNVGENAVSNFLWVFLIAELTTLRVQMLRMHINFSEVIPHWSRLFSLQILNSDVRPFVSMCLTPCLNLVKMADNSRKTTSHENCRSSIFRNIPRGLVPSFVTSEVCYWNVTHFSALNFVSFIITWILKFVISGGSTFYVYIRIHSISCL